jgi:hypothetical protein
LDLHALTAVNDHVEADYVNESLLDRRTKELLIISRTLKMRGGIVSQANRSLGCVCSSW